MVIERVVIERVVNEGVVNEGVVMAEPMGGVVVSVDRQNQK